MNWITCRGPSRDRQEYRDTVCATIRKATHYRDEYHGDVVDSMEGEEEWKAAGAAQALLTWMQTTMKTTIGAGLEDMAGGEATDEE